MIAALLTTAIFIIVFWLVFFQFKLIKLTIAWAVVSSLFRPGTLASQRSEELFLIFRSGRKVPRPFTLAEVGLPIWHYRPVPRIATAAGADQPTDEPFQPDPNTWIAVGEHAAKILEEFPSTPYLVKTDNCAGLCPRRFCRYISFPKT